MLGIYVKALNSDFESIEWYTYYWDKKKRRLFEEAGLDVTPLMRHRGDAIPEGIEYYEAWARKTPHRSLSALLKKIETDFNKFSNIFESYDVILEEVGIL